MKKVPRKLKVDEIIRSTDWSSAKSNQGTLSLVEWTKDVPNFGGWIRAYPREVGKKLTKEDCCVFIRP